MNAMPSNIWEFFMTFDPGERFPLVIVIIVFGTTALVLTVGIIALTIRSIHKNRLNDALKRDLLDRGMSAEEVALLVQTKPTAKHAEWRRSSPPSGA